MLPYVNYLSWLACFHISDQVRHFIVCHHYLIKHLIMDFIKTCLKRNDKWSDMWKHSTSVTAIELDNGLYFYLRFFIEERLRYMKHSPPHLLSSPPPLVWHNNSIVNDKMWICYLVEDYSVRCYVYVTVCTTKHNFVAGLALKLEYVYVWWFTFTFDDLA